MPTKKLKSAIYSALIAYRYAYDDYVVTRIGRDYGPTIKEADTRLTMTLQSLNKLLRGTDLQTLFDEFNESLHDFWDKQSSSYWGREKEETRLVMEAAFKKLSKKLD